MPIAKKTVRKVAVAKTRKQKAIGTARAKAKAAAAKPERARKHAVPEPAAMRAEGRREYLLMTQVVLGVVPSKTPGLALGEVYDAVRTKAAQRDFPGDTHRMWAKQVLLDLKAKGVLGEDGSPGKWRRL